MRIGIDWISLAIFLTAFAVSQIRSLPLSLRSFILAGAFLAIGGLRLREGAGDANLGFAVLALLIAVYYLVRALRALSSPGPGPDEA